MSGPALVAAYATARAADAYAAAYDAYDAANQDATK